MNEVNKVKMNHPYFDDLSHLFMVDVGIVDPIIALPTWKSSDASVPIKSKMIILENILYNPIKSLFHHGLNLFKHI